MQPDNQLPGCIEVSDVLAGSIEVSDVLAGCIEVSDVFCIKKKSDFIAMESFFQW